MAVQTPYVEYIKISRTDELGQDLTPTLEALTQIKLPFTNGVSETYYPISRTRYNDYFLFSLSKNGNSAPLAADAGTIDYNFTSSISTTPVQHSFGFPDFYSEIIPLNTPTTDPLGFFDPITKRYTFKTYTQKDIVLDIESQLNVNVSLFGQNARVSVFIIDPTTYDLSTVANATGRIATEVYTITQIGIQNFNKTVTIPKENISPGNEIVIVFSGGGGFAGIAGVTFQPNSKFSITSTAESGPTLNTIPEPYLTSKFEGSDCDVLLNNESLYRENPFLQDIDYSGNPFVPINFNLLLSGSAAKGTVPASYYTALSQINSRYLGSKNQSSNVNVYKPLGYGGQTTTDFGDPINIGTFGQTPSVDSLDANIYEFEWGGGTTPEILDWGAVKMGRILQASSKDLVKTVDPSEGISTNTLATFAGPSAITARDYRRNVAEGLNATNTMSINLGGSTGYFWLTTQSISDYTHILNGNNPINHEISMYMYPNSTAGSNPTLPNTTKILNTEWGVPSRSSYALTSSHSTVYGTVGNIGGDDNLILLAKNIPISRVTTDTNGYYNSGQTIGPNGSTIGDQIVGDLQNGEKWFVTLYNEFEFPNGEGDYNTPLVSGSLSPYNDGYNTQDSNGDYSNPLAYKGVHEIIGTFDNFGSNQFFILLKNPIIPLPPTSITVFPGINSGSFDINNGNAPGIVASYPVEGNVEGRPGPSVTANIGITGTTVFDYITFLTQNGKFYTGDVIVFPTSEFGGTGGTPIKFVIFIAGGNSKNIGGGEAGNSLGMLIWKARAVGKNEFVMVQDSITGGVSAGAFTSKYVPNYITENFETITKEYGSNTSG